MIIAKPIKISWVTPSGKQYNDTVPMTIEQYTKFVDKLLELKRSNTV